MTPTPPVSRGLGEQQRGLLDLLLRARPLGGDWDPARIELARTALRDKRARELAHAWPTIAASLGHRFPERFAEYARQLAPPPGGGVIDGWMFARDLAATGELHDSVRIQRLALELRVRVRAGFAERRRPPVVRIARTERPRLLVIGVRTRRLGTRLFVVPLGRGRLKLERA
jgi:hypothetical protein